MESSGLQELVDAPRERLDVEYKAWLDLTERETSAKLAKHLCALANFGGGFLVFGIDDDMTPAGPRPAAAGPYDQDTLSGIVKRYLTPAFQVAVHEVTSVGTKTSHPVVWVPSHEAIPVCSARGGPEVGGKPVGIVRGTHYTRGPGPESVAITRPEQWAPLIRRCVLHERQALLAGLEPMLRSPGRPGVEPDDSLQRWHEAGYRRFLEFAGSKGSGELLKRAHYQFSYEIVVAGGGRLEMAGFLNQARQMGHEVLRHVDPGWTMFWVFDGDELQPRSVLDGALGEEEFLECSLEDSSELMVPDFWRMSPAGMATIVRPYREDRRNPGEGFGAGTWFWPFLMAREIAEVIAHARAFAECFEAPETVSLKAEWRGLRGRRLKDPGNPFMEARYGAARDDGRAVTRTVPVASLRDGWPDLTADVLSVVLRLFDPRASVSAGEIRAWSERFRR